MDTIVDFQKYLDDIKSPVVQRLVEDFGAETVFSKERKFTIDDEMLSNIFDSLNASLFNSKLPRVDMKVWHFEDIKNELIKRARETKKPVDLPDIKNIFNGVYSVMIENDLDSIKDESDIVFGRDLLLMNVDKLSHSSFVYIVASVCHEMIHCFDRFFGDYRRLVVDNIEDVDNMDVHKSYTFQRYMKRANKMRINVIEKMNKSDVVLDTNAYSVLTTGQSLYESKKEKLDKTGTVQLGDLILYDHGKKGMIIHFD